jgi:hypothetical protein
LPVPVAAVPPVLDEEEALPADPLALPLPEPPLPPPAPCAKAGDENAMNAVISNEVLRKAMFPLL